MIFLHPTIDFLYHTTSRMEGILLVNKPRGPTSFQIVKLLRKKTGKGKIGHTGTLDPYARGLLVIALGRATRAIRFLQDLKKRYIAVILLGIATETDDMEGKVIKEKKMDMVKDEAMGNVLKSFRGKIKQVPPMYSAVRHKGKRAYKLARQGEEFSLSPREVTVHNIRMIYNRYPYIKIAVECSKGTYIRAIARDIGKKLGGCATLFSLIRAGIGQWELKDAIFIKDEIGKEMIKNNIIPTYEIFKDYPYEVKEYLKKRECF
jgi:tRNA pseudouridine55 synthase